MTELLILLKISIFLTITNVWIFRVNKPTNFRGGMANSMKEEFMAYKLPQWSLYIIGATKITCALLILLSIWLPSLFFYSGIIMLFLMCGAIFMHIRIKDSFTKSIPALSMVFLLLIILSF